MLNFPGSVCLQELEMPYFQGNLCTQELEAQNFPGDLCTTRASLNGQNFGTPPLPESCREGMLLCPSWILWTIFHEISVGHYS